jgi:RNA polymerase sigma-70 factor (ECF subfamily)
MARIGDGDREAFESLYDRYGAPVMRFLHGLCLDRALAEDLTQETFLRAWAAAPRYRPTGRVSTWLFQIAKHRWWTARRRRILRREREAVAADLRARERPDDRGPDRGARRHEGAERIRGALLGLSPKLRLVFVLVRIAGLPYREAAKIAGIRLGTVKSRVAAAEAALRKRLDDAAL